MEATQPTRDELIARLAADLEQFEFVLAAWLEGADARGRVDGFSDIDLWLDVKDRFEDQALKAVRDSLEVLGPLELCVEVDHPHPSIRQAFFRPQGVPEFLIVDTCVQSHSRQFRFTRGIEDERTLVLFDKASVIRYQDLDEPALRANLLARLEELERRAAVFPTWVRKELDRGRYLEALENYQTHILEPLVEALRLRHTPTKVGFYLMDVSSDFPQEVVDKLTYLHSVSNLEEIGQRLPEAIEMLQSALVMVRGEFKTT